MKKRNYLGLSILAVGAAGFLTCCLNGQTGSTLEPNISRKDTTYLIVLNGDNSTLSEAQIQKEREILFQELDLYLNRDYEHVRTFDAINVVEIKANSKYESTLNLLSNVTRVSVDRAYRFGDVYSSTRTQEEIAEGYLPYTTSSTRVSNVRNDNQSALSMNVPDDTKGGEGTFIAVLDTGFLMEHEYFADLTGTALQNARFSYEDLTEVANSGKLTATKSSTAQKGEVGSLYYNAKIPFYYDYGGSSNSRANDYDVVTRVSEHGTHVASIAGANGTYQGIAPNAQLALMKVFYESIPTDDNGSAGASAYDSDILEALNDCVTLGVDALNMSLGSDLDDFDNRSAGMAVIDRLEADGTVCSISAGNAGKTLYSAMNAYRYWTTDQVDTGVLGSYANSHSADIIASSTTEQLYYENGIQVGDHVVGYSDQVDYTNGSDGITKENEKLFRETLEANFPGQTEFEMVLIDGANGTTTGSSSDFEYIQGREAEGFLEGKIAVVDRGDTSFVAKAEAAEDAGCAALIVINNDPTAYEFTFGMSWTDGESYNIPEIPVIFVLYRDRTTIREFCQENLTDNGTAHGKFTLIHDEIASNPNAYQMSDFSSDGATPDLSLNPTIAAPGSSIQGATMGDAASNGMVEDFDTSDVGYLSGTSMSAPNYLGAVAVMIGEQEFTGDAATQEAQRREYIKTISRRAMSTAEPYTTEVTSYGTINEATGINNNSTPSNPNDDYEVTIYNPETTEVVTEDVLYSPRKQGAGVVNVGKAIASSVYLEGLEVASDGTLETVTDENEVTSYAGNDFAKIELRNNALIKQGRLDFRFRVHNPELKTGKYNVKMALMTPQVTSYHTSENELANYVGNEAQFEGAKVSSPFDSYQIMNLDNWNSSVSVDENGDNSKDLVTSIDIGSFELNGQATQDVTSLTYSLSDAQKKFILDNFENGTFLEGYLFLEVDGGENDQLVNLNIPFFGFYGDYATAEAIEPFDFERNDRYNRVTGNVDGSLYGSDLINYLAQNSYSRTSTNLSSMISGTSLEAYQQNNAKSTVLTNNNNLYDYGSQLAYTKDEDGKYTLYAGGTSSDVLYIQQYVYRSINSATVEILDASGKVVKSKYLTSMVRNTLNLYKSHINVSYISGYILSDRAYAEIPLYMDNGGKIPGGNYTLRFTYNLVYGSTQVKEYNLVIDANAPELVSKSVVEINGSRYLRLKFNEIYIPEGTNDIAINAGLLTDYILTKVSDGYIIDVPLNDNTFYEGKLLISIRDGAKTYARYMINADTYLTGLFISDEALTIGYNYSYTKTNNLTSGSEANINETYEVSITDYNDNEANIGSYTAYITFDKNVYSTGLQVFGINDDNTETRIYDVTVLNDSSTIRVTTSYKKFRVYDPNISSDPIYGEVDNASVSIIEAEHGSVYVDKVTGRSGDRVTVYAIADDGYKVGSVVVNGVTLTADDHGNYPFTLVEGQNTVTVTFVAE